MTDCSRKVTDDSDRNEYEANYSNFFLKDTFVGSEALTDIL